MRPEFIFSKSMNFFCLKIGYKMEILVSFKIPINGNDFDTTFKLVAQLEPPTSDCATLQ